jgi:Cu/Ag efflux pump CusA
MKLLVVEDDREAAAFLRRALSEAGHAVDVADTGRTGLLLAASFVTLFGVAARNSILLISHLERLIEAEGHEWSIDTVLLATRERVTPILMTALVTGLGVLPLAISTGQAGREIQGPMAIVILGGLITSTIASLVLLPSLAWRYARPRVTDAHR